MKHQARETSDRPSTGDGKGTSGIASATGVRRPAQWSAMRWAYLSPRYWPTWLGLGLLRSLALLPFRTQLKIGAVLGSVARHVFRGHVHVARRNLELCLPERSVQERERILKAHFRSLGMTLAETASTWWFPQEQLSALGHIEGMEYLDRALAAGKGAILLAAHFTTLEISGGIIAASRPTHAVHKPTKDQLLTEILAVRRDGFTRGAISRDDIRAVVHALKLNGVVWYAPDQAYRAKGAEMVPFFGLPVASNTAISRLARISGAQVLPFFAERLPDAGGYRVMIHPPLENFPSGDNVADTRRYYELIEAHARLVPEQYLWVHRRFKGLAPDYPGYYE